MNLVVLMDILRILVTQVQSLQNELNSYRWATPHIECTPTLYYITYLISSSPAFLYPTAP